MGCSSENQSDLKEVICKVFHQGPGIWEGLSLKDPEGKEVDLRASQQVLGADVMLGAKWVDCL